jgi:AraC-like DNA-binding protein
MHTITPRKHDEINAASNDGSLVPDEFKDDGGRRVNVAITPYGVAIACVASNDAGQRKSMPPLIMHIDSHKGGSRPSQETGAPRRCAYPSKDYQFWKSVSELLIRAVEHGCTECDPFVQHVVFALCAIAEKSGVNTGVTGRPVHGGLTPWQEKMAKEMLGRDLQNPTPLRDVAQACGLSVSHFGRAFKFSAGIPPHRWLLYQRLEMAKKLLAEGGCSLSEVAGECGFSEQAHLTHAFSRRFGISPGAWQRNNGPKDRSNHRVSLVGARSVSHEPA